MTTSPVGFSQEYMDDIKRWSALVERCREHGWILCLDGSPWTVLMRAGESFSVAVDDCAEIERRLDADTESYVAWRAQQWEAA